MSETTFINIMVCVDCMFAAEGLQDETDTPDCQPWSFYPDARHGNISPNFGDDDENGEYGVTDFSSTRCDGCGSSLAGSRYRYAVHTL